jgi:hypothetical protein
LKFTFSYSKTRDFRSILLSRQEVSESGKKQQRLRCTKPRAVIGIHGGGGYVVAGGWRHEGYVLVGVGLGGGGGGGVGGDGGDGRLL